MRSVDPARKTQYTPYTARLSLRLNHALNALSPAPHPPLRAQQSRAPHRPRGRRQPRRTHRFAAHRDLGRRGRVSPKRVEVFKKGSRADFLHLYCIHSDGRSWFYTKAFRRRVQCWIYLRLTVPIRDSRARIYTKNHSVMSHSHKFNTRYPGVTVSFLLFWGTFPIRYVSYCISMYLECILSVS